MLLFVLWRGNFWSRLLEKVFDRHKGAFKKEHQEKKKLRCSSRCCCWWRSLERSNLGETNEEDEDATAELFRIFLHQKMSKVESFRPHFSPFTWARMFRIWRKTCCYLSLSGRERERAWQQDHSWPETKMNNSLLTFLPEQKAFFQLVIQCSASLRKATGFWLRSILVVENPWLQSLTSVNKDSTLAFFIGVQCPLWSGQ